MRSVITFWQTPEDEEEFVAFLLKEEIVAISADWKQKQEELQPTPLSRFMAKQPTDLLLAIPGMESDLYVESRIFSGDQVSYAITTLRSPVIGWRRGLLQDRCLAQSNVHAYQEFSLETGKVIRKTNEFRHWCSRVFSWLRRSTPEKLGQPAYRSSRRVKDAVEKGMIELVLY